MYHFRPLLSTPHLSLNQNLTKINTSTKTLWGYINGEWKDLHIKAYYDAIPVWVNGEFGIEMSNGVYRITPTYSTTSAFTRDGNLLRATLTSGRQAFTLVAEEQIDFSAYSKVTVKTSKGNIELDVSGLEQSGYLCVSYIINAQNIPSCAVRVASAKNDFGNNTVANYANSVGSAGEAITISEITIE